MPEEERSRGRPSSRARKAEIKKEDSAKRGRSKKVPASLPPQRVGVPEVSAERATDAAPSAGRDEARSPDDRRSPVLVVTDVRILGADEDATMSHMEPGHPFPVEVLFRIEDPGADDAGSPEIRFDVQVYADPIQPGPASLVAERNAMVPSYRDLTTARLQATGLSRGIYRLVTTVTITEPVNGSGYHDGPLVSVA